jgi:hypothetical protein
MGSVIEMAADLHRSFLERAKQAVRLVCVTYQNGGGLVSSQGFVSGFFKGRIDYWGSDEMEFVELARGHVGPHRWFPVSNITQVAEVRG